MAALQALEAIGGELDDDQANFHAALAAVELDAPNGRITLDDNRQAIGTVFITEVREDENGELYNTFVSKVEGVTQTLGMTPEEFRAIGLPGRDTPQCN
jgi:branched-chain amino acid transport system substrate-binding protein